MCSKRLILVFWVVLLVIFSGFVLGEVVISEVMYNPKDSVQCPDANCEWIELYNNETSLVELSGWTIDDNSFENVVILPNEYIIVARELIDVNGGNSFEAYWGNNDGIWNSNDGDYKAIDSYFTLKNGGGDTIILKDNGGEIVDSLIYSNGWGANGDGKTLQFFDGSWNAAEPTPGYSNGINEEVNQTEPSEETENIVLSTYLNSEIYIGQEYTKLFEIKIENQEGCSSKKDLITVYYNITNSGLVKEDIFEREIGCSGTANTGEFIPSEPGNYVLCGEIISSTVEETNFEDNSVCMDFTVLDTSSVLCDIELEITTDGTFIYQEGEKIKFKTGLNDESFPFEIEYWIEDLFGNYYKKPYVSANTNQKSWTTKIDEEDRILLIKARVDASCNDTDLTNNYDEKMFVVVESLEKEEEETEEREEEEEKESSIEIINVKPEEVSFGDIVSAELNIYKNSTGKYSLSIWVEMEGKKISEKTKFHLKTKDREYKLFLPVQLKPNCDEKIDNGDAELIVEGLGIRVEKEIEVSGINEDNCKKIIEKEECEACEVCETVEKKIKEESLVLLGKGESVEESILNEDLISTGKEGILNKIKGIVVYESSSEKAKNLIPYIIIVVLGILSLILIWKRI